jgi:cbb3-type cytochrome oxidase maturation protein
MSVLIFLIPITIGLGLLGLCCFLWSLKAKQYEDLQGEASRILFDDADKKL